jgi:hypothetical protein
LVNRPLADGTKGEVAIVRTLKPFYPLADRRAKQGFKDRGDIGGIAPGLVIESKHCPKSYAIAEWLKETDREVINEQADAGLEVEPLGCVWFKLKGTTNPLDWPVMMRGRFFIPLLLQWTGSGNGHSNGGPDS